MRGNATLTNELVRGQCSGAAEAVRPRNRDRIVVCSAESFPSFTRGAGVPHLAAMICLATEADVPALASLFWNTVRTVNRRDYSPAQIAAWAGDAPDEDKWRERLNRWTTLVESHGSETRGFVEVNRSGEIGALYVHAAHQRRGIGRSLLEAAESWARGFRVEALHSEASITALPLFTALGYYVLERQEVEYRGCRFINFRVRKAVGARDRAD